ncbi:hypothetical protein CRUP_012719 [Coryphaenoides rupestris]|nr:hypothetical protein CRUP_012719 [Coryphaenoides rupestris]
MHGTRLLRDDRDKRQQFSACRFFFQQDEEKTGNTTRPHGAEGPEETSGDQRRPAETGGDQRRPEETSGDQRRPCWVSSRLSMAPTSSCLLAVRVLSLSMYASFFTLPATRRSASWQQRLTRSFTLPSSFCTSPTCTARKLTLSARSEPSALRRACRLPMSAVKRLAAAVERAGVPRLLVAVHHLIHVAVQSQPPVDQSQHLLCDGRHLHTYLRSRVLGGQGQTGAHVDDDGEEEDVEGPDHQEGLLQHQDLVEGVVDLRRPDQRGGVKEMGPGVQLTPGPSSQAPHTTSWMCAPTRLLLVGRKTGSDQQGVSTNQKHRKLERDLQLASRENPLYVAPSGKNGLQPPTNEGTGPPLTLTESSSTCRGNHYLFSPTRPHQTHRVRLASKTVESYTKLGTPASSDEVIEYGPFRDVEYATGLAATDTMRIHYENNSPFLTISSITRTIEETVDLRHTGAFLKGPFSRYDYQRQSDSGISSVKSFKVLILPLWDSAPEPEPQGTERGCSSLVGRTTDLAPSGRMSFTPPNRGNLGLTSTSTESSSTCRWEREKGPLRKAPVCRRSTVSSTAMFPQWDTSMVRVMLLMLGVALHGLGGKADPGGLAAGRTTSCRSAWVMCEGKGESTWLNTMSTFTLSFAPGARLDGNCTL